MARPKKPKPRKPRKRQGETLGKEVAENRILEYLIYNEAETIDTNDIIDDCFTIYPYNINKNLVYSHINNLIEHNLINRDESYRPYQYSINETYSNFEIIFGRLIKSDNRVELMDTSLYKKYLTSERIAEWVSDWMKNGYKYLKKGYQLVGRKLYPLENNPRFMAIKFIDENERFLEDFPDEYIHYLVPHFQKTPIFAYTIMFKEEGSKEFWIWLNNLLSATDDLNSFANSISPIVKKHMPEIYNSFEATKKLKTEENFNNLTWEEFLKTDDDKK